MPSFLAVSAQTVSSAGSFPALIVVGVVALIIGVFVWGFVQSAKRRKELTAWSASKGLSFDGGRQSGYDSLFDGFNCLCQGNNRYAYNVMEGAWSGRPIVAFDYHYETYTTNSKGQRETHDHVFSAVTIDSGLPLKPLLIRHEGLFDKIAGFLGMEDINFESAEFSRKFFVKSSDRKWAYDVLPARTLQLLLDSPVFTIEFAGSQVMAHRDCAFAAVDFEAATGLVTGILNGFPGYLVKDLSGEN